MPNPLPWYGRQDSVLVRGDCHSDSFVLWRMVSGVCCIFPPAKKETCHKASSPPNSGEGDPNGLSQFPLSCQPRPTKREEKWITIRDRRDRKMTEEACINITFTHMRSIFIKSINGEECELLDLFEI